METETLTKLLIVDDKPENLRALEVIIRSPDREIFHAATGEEALTLLLKYEFALAILDVQMPGMNGFELAELMRGTAKTRHIPIVFVSAAGRELNYAFKGYEAGAVDFLQKPLDIGAVQSKVNVFVSLYQQRRETQRQLLAIEKIRAEQEVLLLELNRMQVELQRAVRMRDDFMSMVAHELRTPLNTLSIESTLRTMALQAGRKEFFSDENLRKMAERDTRQIESMVRLIDDMLDVSRIQNGSLSVRPRPAVLAGILTRVVDDLQTQAENAGSTITLQSIPDVTGMWDEFRIEQILINLLTNAIRYGRGQPIEVKCLVDGNKVYVAVTDRGIGISDADKQRVFAPFERAISKDSSGGLGLGLFIAKQLAEAHGGNITIRSVVNEGSSFTMVLPIEPSVTLERTS